MFFNPRTYQQLQNLERESKRAGDHHCKPAIGWRTSPTEIRRGQEMLLVHQTGSVKIGEVVRYTLTYTPSYDRILPSPSQLYVRIKNTSAIVLRGAYLHGPYTLYAATYPSTFNPNQRPEYLAQYDPPDFEPNLKAGGSWTSSLKVPENIRETAGKANVKRTTDGGVPSCTWIIEVSSQVLFSVTAAVDFEILVGRDERSIELGFSALTGHGVPVPAQLQDHQQGRGKARRSAAQPKGVYSKAIGLVVDDTASLWNKPALPEWNDDGKERGQIRGFQERRGDSSPILKGAGRELRSEHEPVRGEPTSRKQKNVHLVVLTHGLHSNLGADMLYLKESIDAAAKEAREDARKRRGELRKQEKKNSESHQGHGKENDVPTNSPGTSTAPLISGQEGLDSEMDEEEQDEEEVIVRGFSGNAVRTERGIQYLGKRLAKYVLSVTYPDQPFLPVKKSMTKSLSRAFTGSQSSDVQAGLPAHKDSSIHHGTKKASHLAYKITSISFIAHSLGGLTQTYAIAYIHKHSPHFFEEIKPINFVTMASPFLGLSNENPMYVKFALDFGLVGRTGQDLGLTWRAPTMVRNGWDAMIGGIGAEGQRAQKNPDPQAKPLLRVLPSGPAHQVLKLFRNRTVYSNVVNDGIVPLRTSCLLFLDWSGLGRVEKARRENGLIGTMAGWGWAEFTGVNSTERRHRGFDSGADSQADSYSEGSRSTSKTRQHQMTVPQPAADATKNDTITPGEGDPKTQSSIERRTERFEDEEYDVGKSKDESPTQPPHPLTSLFNFLRPNQNKSHHHSPKQTKIYKRSQTTKGEVGDATRSTEDATTNRPGMARGESLLDDPDVLAPPKTTFFESAGDILNPPLPTEEFLMNPASRPRTIFHDRIYHPEDIPPPPPKQRSSLKRTFSSDGSKKSLNRVDTDYGAAAFQPQPDTSGMKVEEKIARAYHHDLSWRKVLVRLEPDAHNNIFVRRMFSNAYGWPVVKHLVDTHFSSAYSAVTADDHEPSSERAKPIKEPVGEHGEELKNENPDQEERTSGVREAQDDIGILRSGQGRSLSSPIEGRKKLERQDSAMWDDAMFEVTDDDDDVEIDATLSPRERRQLLEAPQHGNRGHTGTTDAEIAKFLSPEPKRQPEGISMPKEPEAAAHSPVTDSPREEVKISVAPSGGTTSIGLGKTVHEQLGSPGSQTKKSAKGEEQQQSILRDITKMSMYEKQEAAAEDHAAEGMPAGETAEEGKDGGA
ncbi:MAG: hypothetical protein Q9191_001188 [Dirinaria sp. TL-2023a]